MSIHWPYYCTVHVYVLFIFVIVCGLCSELGKNLLGEHMGMHLFGEQMGMNLIGEQIGMNLIGE